MQTVNFEQITLKNFKCHEYMDFSFTPNRFVSVTGRNGSGKTSIIDALVFALYDTTTKGNKPDEVIRKRAGKDCCVTLTFTIGEDSYKIENYRKDTKHKDNKYFYKNGSEIHEETRRGTNKLIQDLIMPYDIFSNCLLFSQFISNSFTSLTHAGQKDILDKMLLLEKYDVYLERINTYQKRCMGEKTELEKDIDKINALVAATQQQIEELHQDREKLKSDASLALQVFNAKSESIVAQQEKFLEQSKPLEEKEQLWEKEKDIVEKESLKLEALRNKKELELSKLESILQTKLGEINESRLEKLSQLQELDKTISDLKDEINRLEKERLVEESKAKDDIRDEAAEKTKDLTATLEKLKAEKESSKSTITRMKSDFEEKKKSVLRKEEQLKKFEKKDNICPLCGQDIPEDSDNTHIEQEKQALEAEINELKESVKTLAHEINELVRKLNDGEEIKSLEEQIAEIQKKYQGKFDSRIAIIRSTSQIHVESAQKKKSYTENKKQEETERINNEAGAEKQKLQTQFIEKRDLVSDEFDKKIIQNNLTLDALKEQLKTKEDEINALKKMRQQVDILEQEKQSLEQEVVRYKENIKSQSLDIKSKIEKAESNIKDKANQLEQINTTLQEYEQKFKIIDFWKKGFGDSGIKAVLLDEAVPILNRRANELSQLTENIKVTFDSQKTLKSGELRNNFSINVVQTQNLSELAELSAGETRMTNIITLLCLRHLLETMQNMQMNILLLDEILDSLDPENAQVAINMIRNLSSNYCVLLISHTLRDFIEADEALSL